MQRLSAIERTAWLTVYCRHWARRDKAPILDDLFASWLAEAHPEHEPARVARRTREGVAVRSALIDEWILNALRAGATPESPWNVWVLGAGLDARWLRLGAVMRDRVAEYREFDRAELLCEKQELVRRSPFVQAYAPVVTTPGDLFETLPRLPRATRPTLVVLEGVTMYLAQRDHERLLDVLRQKLPEAVLIADMYSAYAVRAANRQRGRILGGIDARFGWGPDDVPAFFRAMGWTVVRAEPITPRVLDRIPPLGWLPLPRRIRESYLLVQASVKSIERGM